MTELNVHFDLEHNTMYAEPRLQKEKYEKDEDQCKEIDLDILALISLLTESGMLEVTTESIKKVMEQYPNFRLFTQHKPSFFPAELRYFVNKYIQKILIKYENNLQQINSF